MGDFAILCSGSYLWFLAKNRPFFTKKMTQKCRWDKTKFLGFSVFAIFETPKNDHFWTTFWTTSEPFLEPLNMTLQREKGSKMTKKGSKKWPIFGPPFGQKWVIFGHPKMPNLMFWRQNVNFWGFRGPRDTRNDPFLDPLLALFSCSTQICTQL